MKKIVTIMLIQGLVLILSQTAWAFSGAGSGTETNPYIITDVNQLQEMQGGLNAWYELGNDVNAFNTVNWNGGQGFLPVGDSAHGFAGHFDGRGLTISRPVYKQGRQRQHWSIWRAKNSGRQGCNFT